jgi:hypothetical protein
MSRPRVFAGSSEAKRLAAGILEGLSGVRGPQEASVALGVSLTRYYHLETRALAGLVAALEPRGKGRRKRPEDEVARLRRDKERLEHELHRAQALVRVAQRTVGLPSSRPVVPGEKVSGKKGRRRRALVRVRGVVEALRRAETPGAGPAVPEKEDGDASGQTS